MTTHDFRTPIESLRINKENPTELADLFFDDALDAVKVKGVDGFFELAKKSDTNKIVTAFVSIEDVTVANTVAETTLLGQGNGTLVILANSTDIGDRFSFTIQGIMSSTANPTLRLQLKSGGVLLADTGASSIGNLTNGHWIITGDVVTRTIGGVGTVITSGSFMTSSGDHFEFVNIVPVVLNTTINRVVDVTAIWGTAATGNTITQQIAHLTKFVSP